MCPTTILPFQANCLREACPTCLRHSLCFGFPLRRARRAVAFLLGKLRGKEGGKNVS